MPTEVLVRKNTITISNFPQGLKRQLTCFRKADPPVDPEELYVADNKNPNVIYAPKGLLGVVLRYCGPSTVVRGNNALLPRPHINRLSGTFREGQSDILARILSVSGGIVKCPAGLGKSYIICTIAELYWGDIPMMVVTNKKDVLEKLHDDLTNLLPNAKIRKVNGSSKYKPGQDVYVVSAMSLHKIPQNFDGIMLYDEVQGCAGPTIFTKVMAFQNTHNFAFSATPNRTDNAEIIIEALFGEIIAEVSYDDAVKFKAVAPMTVFMIPVNGAPVEIDNNFYRKKLGIWYNRNRNQAAIDAFNTLPPDERGLILVDSVEHALILKKGLPHYRIAHGGINYDRWLEFSKKKLLPPDDVPVLDTAEIAREFAAVEEDLKKEFLEKYPTITDEVYLATYRFGDWITFYQKYHYARSKYAVCDSKQELKDFKAGVYVKYIATSKWREGISVDPLRVTSQMSSGRSITQFVQSAGRGGRIYEGKDQAYFVDYYDQFDFRFKKLSEERIKIYKSLGWTIIKEKPNFTEIFKK